MLDRSKIQQRQQQQRDIYLECQNQEIENLNIKNPSRIDYPLIAIKQFVQQFVHHSEQLSSHVNIFQDKVIVQGNGKLSTIIKKAHQGFSQENEELEQTLYHTNQYYLIFSNIFIAHMRSDMNSIIYNLRIVPPASNSTSSKV